MATAHYPLTNKQLIQRLNQLWTQSELNATEATPLLGHGYTVAKVRDQLVSAGLTQQQITNVLTEKPSFGQQLQSGLGGLLIPGSVIGDLFGEGGGSGDLITEGTGEGTSDIPPTEQPNEPTSEEPQKNSPGAPGANLNPSSLLQAAKDAGTAGVLATFLGKLWHPARLLELLAGVILLYMGIRTLTGGALPAPRISV